MALILKPKKEKKIEIPGTDIELQSLYVRIDFAGRMNGVLMEIAPMSFQNKQKFIEQNPVLTTVQMNNLSINIDTAIEEQSVSSAHKYAKIAFEQLGYEVEIDLN
jgi:hypothetical protein